MNEHDALELAYKNGYEKAARGIFEELEKVMIEVSTEFSTMRVIGKNAFNKLKKKYTEGATE